LRFPPVFFYGDDPVVPQAEGVSFRARSNLTAARRNAALGAAAIVFLLADWMDTRFVLPDVALPDLAGQRPEVAAQVLRQEWSLGDRPAPNMVHLLESKGVRVFSLAEDCRALDAFATWRDDVPFVFLNTQKSAERSRFDAAHELGHLVLHKRGGATGKDEEMEADAFASAFLMPESQLLGRVPRFPTLANVLTLKAAFRVSAMAMVYRLHTIGAITEWHYRTLCIEMSKRGYRTKEPQEGPRETSQLFAKVFTALRAENIGKAAIAADLQVNPDELDAAIFGLAMMQIEGGRSTGTARPKARLRVV
jgi:Zn-dependent peptidase ImmA (M78 family)